MNIWRLPRTSSPTMKYIIGPRRHTRSGLEKWSLVQAWMRILFERMMNSILICLQQLRTDWAPQRKRHVLQKCQVCQNILIYGEQRSSRMAPLHINGLVLAAPVNPASTVFRLVRLDLLSPYPFDSARERSRPALVKGPRVPRLTVMGMDITLSAMLGVLPDNLLYERSGLLQQCPEETHKTVPVVARLRECRPLPCRLRHMLLTVLNYRRCQRTPERGGLLRSLHPPVLCRLQSTHTLGRSPLRARCSRPALLTPLRRL